MVFLVAVQQWYDNNWRLAWKETKLVLISIITVHVIATALTVRSSLRHGLTRHFCGRAHPKQWASTLGSDWCRTGAACDC